VAIFQVIVLKVNISTPATKTFIKQPLII